MFVLNTQKHLNRRQIHTVSNFTKRKYSLTCSTYCSHLWAGATGYKLFPFDRIQKRVDRLVDDLSNKLEPLEHQRR